MLRLVVLFILFYPACCFAATMTETGQISIGLSEIHFHIPRFLKVNKNSLDKYFLKSNFSSNVKLHSQKQDGSNQLVVGNYFIQERTETELGINEDSDLIYFFAPE